MAHLSMTGMLCFLYVVIIFVKHAFGEVGHRFSLECFKVVSDVVGNPTDKFFKVGDVAERLPGCIRLRSFHSRPTEPRRVIVEVSFHLRTPEPRRATVEVAVHINGHMAMYIADRRAWRFSREELKY